MDKLTREAQYHGKIFESVALFKKELAEVDKGRTYSYIIRIGNFLKDTIPEHFKFEEEQIFPIILKKATINEMKLIKDLRQEHADVFRKLNQLKKISSECSPESDSKQIDTAINFGREILQMINDHAYKEDEKLFPLLKKYSLDLEQ